MQKFWKWSTSSLSLLYIGMSNDSIFHMFLLLLCVGRRLLVLSWLLYVFLQCSLRMDTVGLLQSEGLVLDSLKFT